MEVYQSEQLAQIAAEVISHHEDEFEKLIDGTYSVVFLESNKAKHARNRVVHAECSKVSKDMEWCCPFDFKITFYKPNIEHMNEKQLHILMWHELKHCGIDKDVPYIRDHDYFYADFEQIVEEYGMDWSR